MLFYIQILWLSGLLFYSKLLYNIIIMNICNISTILSYITIIYVLASVYYIIFTKKLGTPFLDEVNKYPTLKYLREQSKKDRRDIFYHGIITSIIILIIFRPFINCFSL